MPEDSKSARDLLGDRVWELPPLILHPFSNELGPSQLLAGSKAALMLCGLLPAGDEGTDELTRKLLESRYTEVRMLYFVGKDLLRWVDQSMELVTRTPELAGKGISEQSFASLLVYHAPESVRQKLHKWGVANPEAVFSRALGISAMFREVPAADQLSERFLRYYHRFADHLFVCTQHLAAFTEITADNFVFELYASGEYSRLLEKQWGE